MIEVLVVIAILSVLIAIFIPAVQRARANARRAECANNLHQIGLAVHMYADSSGVLPRARLCPAPWANGADLFCEMLPTPVTYTGPSEIWWAPYDNRPGTDVTAALPGYAPDSLLWPYVEKTLAVFRCPEGVDHTPGSPTYGREFQISYVMNPKYGGKKIADLGKVMGLGGFIWEHDDLPVCESLQHHWIGWNANPQQLRTRHSAYGRHSGVMNILHADGRVDAERRDEP
jgi:prepilin-type processing-associated H-X9-DG protein